MALATTTPSGSVGIRTYQSEQDVVPAYYTFIHPFMPVLPPPNIPFCHVQPVSFSTMETHDQLRYSLPYWPKCQVSLGMSALLVLMPLPKDVYPMASDKALACRSLAQLYSQSAFELIERAMDSSELSHTPYDHDKVPASILHTVLPAFAEPVLALNILALYEYCQRGKTSVMRARINLAIT